MRGGVWLYERGREQRRREDQCEQTGRRHSAVGRENVVSVGAISKLAAPDFPPYRHRGRRHPRKSVLHLMWEPWNRWRGSSFSQRPPAARPGRNRVYHAPQLRRTGNGEPRRGSRGPIYHAEARRSPCSSASCCASPTMGRRTTTSPLAVPAHLRAGSGRRSLHPLASRAQSVPRAPSAAHAPRRTG